MNQRLLGKAVMITGAGSGIGRASAILFAREGAEVTLIDRDPQAGDEVLQEIKHQGWDAHFFVADISVEADVADAVKATVSLHRRVDVLVNSAGVGATGRVHETSIEEWEHVLDTNLNGTFLCCKHTIPLMMEQKRGAILNVGSGLGLVGSRSHHAYGASKGGVVMLTRSIALAYARYDIRANCICPGPIDTPMLDRWLDIDHNPKAKIRAAQEIPLGRLGCPMEVAYAALFLVSDEASYITGSTLPVDGGTTA